MEEVRKQRAAGRLPKNSRGASKQKYVTRGTLLVEVRAETSCLTTSPCAGWHFRVRQYGLVVRNLLFLFMLYE